jgi:hypothetical protein
MFVKQTPCISCIIAYWRCSSKCIIKIRLIRGYARADIKWCRGSRSARVFPFRFCR